MANFSLLFLRISICINNFDSALPTPIDHLSPIWDFCGVVDLELARKKIRPEPCNSEGFAGHMTLLLCLLQMATLRSESSLRRFHDATSLRVLLQSSQAFL